MKNELKELKTNEAEIYSILSPEWIKYSDLPRKTKKRLKSKLKKDIPMWKSSEIHIKELVIDRWHQRKTKPDFKRYCIMSYRLGARG